jgi:hypothetical protein
MSHLTLEWHQTRTLILKNLHLRILVFKSIKITFLSLSYYQNKTISLLPYKKIKATITAIEILTKSSTIFNRVIQPEVCQKISIFQESNQLAIQL